ncbi:hypothetical protein [Nocardia aurantia]|uniref:Uncharacterized protein n=1 Tax=Nocardia aurantia TaxID=2585199 RepID=A0A7K0DU35_9NOCA|nr:hypothetical protein [Nocardia aurantia]MQY29271.1 hypothetical protein [Nocardia aurantia]
MVRALFFVPLACWILATRSRRARPRTGLILAAILAVELVVSFLAWPLRYCRDSVEVLLMLTGLAVLTAGLVADRRSAAGPAVRTRAGEIFTVLGCAGGLLGVLWMVAIDSGIVDGPGGHGGAQPPVPNANQLLPLPAGLEVRSDSIRCAYTLSGPFCTRTFAVGSTDGTPDADVAARVLRHLHDAHGVTLPQTGGGFEGRLWGRCRTVGWWLDRRDESVRVFDATPGPPPEGATAVPHRGAGAPRNAATTVEFSLHRDGCG